MDSGGGAAALGYPDSVDSSPRSRGGESWDEPFPSSAPAPKLRLMCSYGGRIVPRPTDKSLCYLGGETRIVVVDRHSTLADLCSRLSRSLLGGRPFSLKYQLPNEDLDSLISVTTDEDLDNMVDEYDRLVVSSSAAASSGGSSRSSRIRLFLFPSKPESAPSSIGSLLDDSKSETWFVDALNSAIGVGGGLPRGLSTDSASVNCLLGLEDDGSTHSRAGGAPPPEAEQLMLHRPDSSGRLPSVPDSPMVETASSFGSASSAPSLTNLPPIRVRHEDRPSDPRIGGFDDHFSHMNISAGTAATVQPHPPPPILHPTTLASTPTISPSENPSRVFSDDERSEKSEHGGFRKPAQPQPLPQPQLQPQPKVEVPIPDSIPRPMYAVNPIADARRELPPVSDATYHMPQAPQPLPPIQAADPSYILPPAMQPDQHQQFIPANPHYVHHPATGTMVPIQSYYQITPHSIPQSQQPHHFDPQIPMYYLPVRPNPAPSLTNPASIPPHSVTRTMPASAPAPAATLQAPPPRMPIVHVAPDQAHPYAGMGYHMLHHHPSQMYYAAQPASTTPQMLPTQFPATPIADAQSPPGDAKRA